MPFVLVDGGKQVS